MRAPMMAINTVAAGGGSILRFDGARWFARFEEVPDRTAAEALAKLQATTFDCMVMDLSLPDLSGYELLEKKDIVTDVPGAFKAWSRGTVVRSWLLDLMVLALEENPSLDDVSDYTADSGEGRWTVIEGVENAVPMPVISAALFSRFSTSRSNRLQPPRRASSMVTICRHWPSSHSFPAANALWLISISTCSLLDVVVDGLVGRQSRGDCTPFGV